MTATQTKPRVFSAVTHKGLVRSVNEDAVLTRTDLGLWAVADGMGGHAGGDFASQTVIDALSHLDASLEPGAVMHAARDAIHAAHDAIRAESARRDGIIIGATIVLLALAEEHFMCLWAGDSRLYRLHDGRLEMVSLDHSVVGEMVEAGHMTWAEAERHAHANQITRAVGVGEHLEIDKRRGLFEPGDRFLLCSDGLTKYADAATLCGHLHRAPIEDVASDLLQVALAGGATDNVSIIAVEV